MTAGALGLETVGIGKRFGALVALDDVSLRVAAGSFHALLGENGAGKSTLVKCVMGYYPADAGAVLIDGREREIGNPRDAQVLGIGMVYQHFTLVPGMTVLENLTLNRPDLPARVDWRAERRRAEEFMRRMPFAVALDAVAGELAAGEKQKVEILKQLYLDRRLLILDEPTSVLTPAEADEVLGLLRAMTREGRLTVLMITHKFREVMAFADQVTVLRRGRLAGGGGVATLTPESMARMMVGEGASIERLSRSPAAPGEPRLQLAQIAALADSGRPALDGVTLTVRAGEIVGIAGVSGNGQRALVEVLAGQRRAAGGSMTIDGKPYRATRADMRALGIRCLPEEPLGNACVGTMSVAENMGLRDFDEPPMARGGWRVDAGALTKRARALIQRYGIRTPGPAAPVSALSGGNVQRVVLARELGGSPAVLVVANPCFGLDFQATAEIRRQIVQARDGGAAVLLISEDLDEILELADRIVVMLEGRIVHETPAAGAQAQTLGRYMAGHHAPEREAA